MSSLYFAYERRFHGLEQDMTRAQGWSYAYSKVKRQPERFQLLPGAYPFGEAILAQCDRVRRAELDKTADKRAKLLKELRRELAPMIEVLNSAQRARTPFWKWPFTDWS